ncbi:MAG: hypothetical protein Q8R55_02585 [Candidatus Taylorbacteria bacterium]|nr:hypothetical protein [Candidatus Taylorbacteria bacterium]
MLTFTILAVAVLVFAFVSGRYFVNPRVVGCSIVAMYNLGLSVLIFNSSTDLKIGAFIILLLTGGYSYWYYKEILSKKNSNQ